MLGPSRFYRLSFLHIFAFSQSKLCTPVSTTHYETIQDLPSFSLKQQPDVGSAAFRRPVCINSPGRTVRFI